MRSTLPLSNRRLLATLAVVAIGSLAPNLSSAAPGSATMTCTNPVSGANWKISIDFAKSTVDSNPARISDASISWRDRTDGGNYTLDRKSGKLTVVVASSTGGYFLYDLCKPA
jgi:hypothetical protein